MPQLAGGTWYVATTGDDENSCSDPISPCLTINGAIGKATSGDEIRIATGTYTSANFTVVQIDRDVILSGGWDTTFTIQNGTATVDGQNARLGIYVNQPNPLVNVVLERFIIENGKGGSDGGGVYNGGDLTIIDSIVRNNSAAPGIGSGGGIFNSRNLTLINTTVSNNSASYGGGIYYNNITE
jgi:hypothetical protein